jgi:hypothetical protein
MCTIHIFCAIAVILEEALAVSDYWQQRKMDLNDMSNQVGLISLYKKNVLIARQK